MTAGIFGFTDASVGGNHKLRLPPMCKFHAVITGCGKFIFDIISDFILQQIRSYR